MHFLRPDDDPCLLEHDGKAPLLGQHAGDEVLLIDAGHQTAASSDCVPVKPVRGNEAVAQVPGEEPDGATSLILLKSAVPHVHRRGVGWGRQVPRGFLGHGVWGTRPQGGPRGGSGQSGGDGSLVGRTASPRGRVGRLLPPFRGRRVVGRLGSGVLGVRGVPRTPPCPSLEDVGGCLLVFRRGGGVHRLPREVLQRCPGCVELVCN